MEYNTFYFSAHEVTNKKFNDWGLKFHSLNPMNLEGPVHKREVITLGNKVKKQVGVNMDWGSDVVQNTMFKTVSFFFLNKLIIDI